MIEIKRILTKFDSLMENKDFDEAERLLTYWIEECEAKGDLRNRFTLLNELVGFYRMRNDRALGVKACKTLLENVESMDLADKVSGATAYINVATAYKSFGYVENSIPLYEKAKAIYERDLEEKDDRSPALYNNMALALMEYSLINPEINASGKQKDNDLIGKSGSECNIISAQEYFEKALNLLKRMESAENEQAITYLNMSDLAYVKLGPEASESIIEEYVEKAFKLLEKSHADKNPDFRMTAEKCIPVIRHYGYFAMANDLQEMIKVNM